MRSVAAVVLAVSVLTACDAQKRSQGVPTPEPVSENVDSAFKAMDHRHGEAVGQDPMVLAHQFVSVPDGADIILEREAHDDMGINQIRAHLLLISRSFVRGDFTLPGFVHDKTVPGTSVMASKGNQITYTVEDLPHGGAIRIRTSDPEALRAIHSFITFQIAEHRTAR